jgi:rhodanese-related sulfurtransferase
MNIKDDEMKSNEMNVPHMKNKRKRDHSRDRFLFIARVLFEKSVVVMCSSAGRAQLAASFLFLV